MRTYIVIKKLNQFERKAKYKFITGAILMIIFGYSLIAGLRHESEELYDGVPLYAIICAVGAFIIYLGYLQLNKTKLARRYDTIFASDSNGVVTILELATQTGKDNYKILQELERLFQDGMFTNCTLQRSDMPCVIINDAMVGESSVGFTAVVCSTCGAITRIRAGSRGQCESCGSPIADNG